MGDSAHCREMPFLTWMLCFCCLMLSCVICLAGVLFSLIRIPVPGMQVVMLHFAGIGHGLVRFFSSRAMGFGASWKKASTLACAHSMHARMHTICRYYPVSLGPSGL